MALVKYGGGIVQMSGSIAGNVHARNRFGNYTRARTKPVNPRSPSQQAARVAVMFLAEQWREAPMTDAKRTAWQTYANSVNWLNKLGESVTLTGFNMFMRSNLALLRASGAWVDDGPLALGLPAGDPATVISLVSAGTQNVTLTFDDTMDWCGEDFAYLVVEQGIPQNPTRNFFNGPWRYYGQVSASVVAPAVSPILIWGLAIWPFVLGQKIWWRAHIIRGDGRVSTKFLPVPTIVVA